MLFHFWLAVRESFEQQGLFIYATTGAADKGTFMLHLMIVYSDDKQSPEHGFT